MPNCRFLATIGRPLCRLLATCGRARAASSPPWRWLRGFLSATPAWPSSANPLPPRPGLPRHFFLPPATPPRPPRQLDFPIFVTCFMIVMAMMGGRGKGKGGNKTLCIHTLILKSYSIHVLVLMHLRDSCRRHGRLGMRNPVGRSLPLLHTFLKPFVRTW